MAHQHKSATIDIRQRLGRLWDTGVVKVKRRFGKNCKLLVLQQNCGVRGEGQIVIRLACVAGNVNDDGGL